MKWRKIFVYLILNFLLLSCKQVQLSSLHPSGELENKISFLESQINLESFYRAYTKQYSITSGDFIPVLEIGPKEELSKVDKRIQESEILFHRDVRRNICMNGTLPKGTIVAKIVASDNRTYKKWLLVPSVFTLGLANLFSMPFYFYKAELEVDFEIYNSKGEFLKRYEAYGFGEVKVGIAGYFSGLENSNASKDNDAARQSNILAMKQVLSDLKGQLSNDVNFLTENL